MFTVCFFLARRPEFILDLECRARGYDCEPSGSGGKRGGDIDPDAAGQTQGEEACDIGDGESA